MNRGVAAASCADWSTKGPANQGHRAQPGTKVFLFKSGDTASYLCMGPSYPFRRESMSSAFYVVAYLLLIAGVSCLAYLSHIPESYIIASAIIMLGIGVVSGMESARLKNSHMGRGPGLY